MIRDREPVGIMCFMWFLVVSFFSILIFLPYRVMAKEEVVVHPPIPLLDEDGEHVLTSGRPYSSRKSCGNNEGSGCHNYDSITHAYHFEMGRNEARDWFGKVRKLPHLVSPGYFGGYACMGGNNPEVLAKKVNTTEDRFADRGSPGWVLRCSGCHPGGGWMERDREGIRYDRRDPTTIPYLDGDYYNRGTTDSNEPAGSDVVSLWDWRKSGVAEADCLMCHVDLSRLKKFDPQLLGSGTSSALDHFRTLRRTYLAGQGFFRFMGTAILEFINLNTTDDNSKDESAVTFRRTLNGEHNVHTRTKPLYSLVLNDDGEPILDWNESAFDGDRKIAIPMLRFPDNDNCMLCHRTSPGRRGFYGFGDDAEPTYDEDGILIDENYKYDIHKGKPWTENGVTKKIDNCNACHSRLYFRPTWQSTDLDADHNILKGNSDMDCANYLDYRPNARSCEYCHNDAPNPAIPSGHSDMLSAHTERWRAKGDLKGYPKDSLPRIVKAHLDSISCQACHITGKKDRRGKPIQIMYRYRIGPKGGLQIIPYNPRIRYYWKDRNSGYILNRTERNSVFMLARDDEGKDIGVIVDPVSGESFGVSVSARMSHGSWRFGEPDSYEGYIALKKAYDRLLMKKGFNNPDCVMVWIESNEYVMSHNTRSATASLQCADCHSKKQDGSFSAILSPDGLLGTGNVKTVTTLPTKRLVEEGIVELGMPYMKIDADGVVTENVSDILYATKINPSLSILNSAVLNTIALPPRLLTQTEALSEANIHDHEDMQMVKSLLSTEKIFIFRSNYGSDEVRKVVILASADTYTRLLFPTYTAEISLADERIVKDLSNLGIGNVVGDVFSMRAFNASGEEISSFPGDGVVVKIPYRGTSISKERIKIITSQDGTDWNLLDPERILSIRVGDNGTEGYVLFRTEHFSYYGIVDTSRYISGSDLVDSVQTKEGGCFIATAVYGSYSDPHVKVLRKFRDRVLLSFDVGRRLVEFYYTYSPSFATWLKDSTVVKGLVRGALLPVYWLAYFMVGITLTEQILIATPVISAGVIYIVMRRRSEKTA